MARVKASGLILTPFLGSRGMQALDIHFEPAMIISARKVDKLNLNIRSFREPLKRSIKEVMIPSIRKNFDAGGRDPKWQRLAADTLRKKQALGFSSKILVRTGALRRTMGQLNVWTIDQEKAYIQNLPNSIWYGNIHQAGAGGGNVTVQLKNVTTGKMESFTEGSYGSIPARPFVVLRRMDEIKIQKIFNDWLGQRVRMAGLSSRPI